MGATLDKISHGLDLAANAALQGARNMGRKIPKARVTLNWSKGCAVVELHIRGNPPVREAVPCPAPLTSEALNEAALEGVRRAAARFTSGGSTDR